MLQNRTGLPVILYKSTVLIFLFLKLVRTLKYFYQIDWEFHLEAFISLWQRREKWDRLVIGGVVDDHGQQTLLKTDSLLQQ